MASSKDKEDTTNKILWVAGTALITGFTLYYVNKALNEREELQRLRLASMNSGGGGSEE